MLKDDLNYIRDLKKHMDGIHQSIADLMDSVTDTSVHLSDMPHSQRYKDRFAEYVAKKEERQLELLEIEEQYMERYVRIERAIAEIPYQQQQIIRLHYEQRKSWKSVSAETHYSKSYCKKIHTAALKRLGVIKPKTNQKKSATKC